MYLSTRRTTIKAFYSILLVLLGAAKYNHSLLLVLLGADDYNCSLLLVLLGASQYNHRHTHRPICYLLRLQIVSGLQCGGFFKQVASGYQPGGLVLRSSVHDLCPVTLGQRSGPS